MFKRSWGRAGVAAGAWVIGMLAAGSVAHATLIFNQDFNSSGTVSDYVSATPDSHQFNAIGTSGAGVTVAINSGALSYTRGTANSGSFSRTTDFSPTPDTLVYQMDLSVSGNSTAATSAAIFQVGSGFGTANSAESNANTYARFAVNLGANPGEFSIRDITNGTNSTTLSGTQTLTWVLNNSGSTLSYTAPGGGSASVADDKADLYAGNTLLFDDVAVQTATQVMTDLKFAYSAGTGTINIDNILINTVPEPTCAALMAALALAAAPKRRPR